jgi:hypothetical protein
MSTYATYEDSTFVTRKIGRDMSANIIMERPVVLGRNANVDYIVEIGQEVQVGDELIRYETSFEEDTLNKFLTSVGKELREEIKTLGKTPIKSKYSGVIEDIKIYSTVELNDLSPSLKKIVSKYYDNINKKKKLLNKYDDSNSIYKCGVLINDPTAKVETKDGKIKGYEVGDGVLIEFYINYQDILGIGDKLTFFTALKSIVGEVIPEGYEPYSIFRPEEEVSSLVGPSAVLARGTPSIILTMFANKVLVELKRSLYGIYMDKPWKPTTESVDISKEDLLFEQTINLYREKNIDDNQSYYTRRAIKQDETICPIYYNNKLTIVGNYIKSSNEPNCKIENEFLISLREIDPKEELTISNNDYQKLNK